MYFNPRKNRVNITAVIYHAIFITLAPGQAAQASAQSIFVDVYDPIQQYHLVRISKYWKKSQLQ
jgi:hypothetical protein